MKKNYFLLAALTLVGGAFSQANAQDAGDYYLYSSTQKAFLSCGAAWGTQAVVDKYGIPITLNKADDGIYTITFKDWTSSQGLYDANNSSDVACLYTDRTPTKFKFNSTSTDGDYTISATDGSKYLTVNSNNVLAWGTDANAATTWELKTKDERDAIVNAYPDENAASVAASAGITGVTTASELSTKLGSYVSTVVKTIAPGDFNFTAVRGGTGGTNPREVYQGTGKFTYTATGLKAGLYKVTTHSLERDGSNGDCATLANSGYYITTSYLKAGDQQTRLKAWAEDRTSDTYPNSIAEAKNLFNAGKYESSVYTYVGSDGKLDLTVGVPNYGDHRWFIFSDVTLTLYQQGVSDEAKTEAINTATTLSDEKMRADAKTALTTALTTFQTSQTNESYQALENAIQTAKTSVSAYAHAKTVLTNREALLATTNFYTADAYKTYYTDVKTAYDAGTLTDADASALEDPTGFGWHASKQTSAFLGSVTGVTGYDGSVPYVNTWSVEGAGDGSNFLVPFYEYWVGDGDVLGAKTLTLTQTGLEPNKNYKVSAWVRTRLSNNQTAPVANITMNVNGGNSVAISGTQIGTSQLYLDRYTAFGTADADGTLKLNIVVGADSKCSWVSFRDVKYELLTDKTISETENYDDATTGDYNVTVNRTLLKGWNTLVLPFALTNDQVTSLLGSNAKVAEFSNNSENTVNFNTTTSGIKANTPVMVYVGSDVTSFTPGGVTLVAGTPEVKGTNWTFEGNYNASYALAEGDYMLYDDNTWWKNESGDNYSVKGMRAYIKANTTNAAKLSTVRMVIDGTATAINGINSNANVNNAKLYNLAGQRVNNTYKGVVIVNGKKVILK